MKCWKLEGKKIVECKDILEWAQFIETKERLIKHTQMPLCRVSTVFLGLDHSFNFGPEEIPPMVFESMILGGALNYEQLQYATYEDSEEGHKQLCEMAEKATQQHSARIMVSILIALLVWVIFD